MLTDLPLPEVTVPANASRFFTSRDEALRQPRGRVRLAWDSDDPYLFNAAFDEGLIRHDGSYCTSVVDFDGHVQVPTMGYFANSVAPRLSATSRIVDIGCGQGEFVHALRALGRNAVGYDPVVRDPSDHLHARYWDVNEEPANLYVMRCVLPHISNPWVFVQEIGRCSPDCLILIEFQRLEWILQEGIWYQLSHDHVNVFSVEDFLVRFDVVDHGSFSNGEWAWVLLSPDTYERPPGADCPVTDGLDHLFEQRQGAIETALTIDRPLAVWGAAGKGIVLVDALKRSGLTEVIAVDADRARWDRFLETSGVEVRSPARARAELPRDAFVIVSNPNHHEAIRQGTPASWTVVNASDLAVGHD